MSSNKQPAGLKLTSGSWEQTFYEATIADPTGGERTYTRLTLRTIISWVLANRLNDCQGAKGLRRGGTNHLPSFLVSLNLILK